MIKSIKELFAGKGTGRVNKVFDAFEKQIVELEVGMDEIEDEIVKNKFDINCLENENRLLGEVQEKARALQAKLVEFVR